MISAGTRYPSDATRLGWALYSPDTDDYLASLDEEGFVNALAWCSHPAEAILYPTIPAAEEAAIERISNFSVDNPQRDGIVITEILDTERTLYTEQTADVLAPSVSLLSPSEIGRAHFSGDFAPTAARLGIGTPLVRNTLAKPAFSAHQLSAGAWWVVGKVLPPGDRRLLVAVDLSVQPRQILAAWPVPLSIAPAETGAIATLHALCSAVGNPIAYKGIAGSIIFGERHTGPGEFEEIVGLPTATSGVLQARMGVDPESGDLLLPWVYSIDDDALCALLDPRRRPR